MPVFLCFLRGCFTNWLIGRFVGRMGEIGGGIASVMFHEIRGNPEVVTVVTINRKIAGFVKLFCCFSGY